VGARGPPGPSLGETAEKGYHMDHLAWHSFGLLLTFFFYFARPLVDIYCLVQFSLEEGRHPDRRNQRRLSHRPQAHAAVGGDLERAVAQARPWQDALPQDRQCQQGP